MFPTKLHFEKVKTVGELKKLMAEMPDDTLLGEEGHDGNGFAWGIVFSTAITHKAAPKKLQKESKEYGGNMQIIDTDLDSNAPGYDCLIVQAR